MYRHWISFKIILLITSDILQADTNRNMNEWLVKIQKIVGSVEMNAIDKVDVICSRGVFRVGNLCDGKVKV